MRHFRSGLTYYRHNKSQTALYYEMDSDQYRSIFTGRKHLLIITKRFQVLAINCRFGYLFLTR